MSINDLYCLLKKYQNVMDLNAPISRDEVENFELDNNIRLPNDYKEMLSLFNGGEIFVPGTFIYGVTNNNEDSVRFANRSSLRKIFHIPCNYMIFAKVNYGDFLCINLNFPHDVIQWDHEKDEQFCYWSSLVEWMSETISEYCRYEKGNK